MPATYVNNPIAFAQFNLRNGWKGMGWATLGTLVAMVGLTYVIQLQSRQAGMAYWAVSRMALFGSAALLGLVLPGRVAAAIRNDRSADLMESHRLMPIPPGVALLGYVFGTGAPVFAAVAMLFMGGAVLVGLSGNAIGPWFLSYATFVGPLSVLVAFGLLAGFMPKGGGILLWALVWPIVLSGGFLLNLLPGMSLFVTPLLDETVVSDELPNALGTFAEVLPFHAAGLLLTLCVAAIFFQAARRKWRADDEPSMGPVLSMALWAVWVTASVAGYMAFDLLVQDYDLRGDPELVFVAGLFATLLFAHGVLNAAGAAQATRRDAALHGDLPPPGWPVPVSACAAGIALLVSGQVLTIVPAQRAWFSTAPEMTTASLVPATASGIGAALLAVVLGVAGSALIASSAARLRMAPLGWLLLWLVGMWVAPVLAEALVQALAGGLWEGPGVVAGLSPGAVLIRLASQGGADAWQMLPLTAAGTAVAGMIWIAVWATASRRIDEDDEKTPTGDKVATA